MMSLKQQEKIAMKDYILNFLSERSAPISVSKISYAKIVVGMNSSLNSLTSLNSNFHSNSNLNTNANTNVNTHSSETNTVSKPPPGKKLILPDTKPLIEYNSPQLINISPNNVVETFHHISLSKGYTILCGTNNSVLRKPLKVNIYDVMKSFENYFVDKEFSWLANEAQHFHFWLNSEVLSMSHVNNNSRELYIYESEIMRLCEIDELPPMQDIITMRKRSLDMLHFMKGNGKDLKLKKRLMEPLLANSINIKNLKSNTSGSSNNNKGNSNTASLAGAARSNYFRGTDETFEKFVVSGMQLEPVHCIFKYRSLVDVEVNPNASLILTITPCPINRKDKVVPFAEVYVNGDRITKETVLNDKDIIKIGLNRFMEVRLPTVLTVPALPRTPGSRSSQSRTATGIIPTVSFSDNVDMTPWGILALPDDNQENNKVSIFKSLSLQNSSSIKLSLWDECMLCYARKDIRKNILECEIERLHSLHMEVNRHIGQVLRYFERSKIMQLTTFEPSEDLIDAIFYSLKPSAMTKIAEAIHATDIANALAKDLIRGVELSFKLRLKLPSIKSISEGEIIVVDFEDKKEYLSELDLIGINETSRVYSGNVYCKNRASGGGGGSWWWSMSVFKERFTIMREMVAAFESPWCSKDATWLDELYSPECDPFQDTFDDELIGVSFVYLDSLQYLLDINDSYCIVNYQGYKSGFLQCHARVWIDEVDPLPLYINVDKECHLRQFMGRNCIIKFSFDGMMGLPDNLCAATHLKFKFFNHSAVYTTPKHDGVHTNPRLRSSVHLEQKITRDFIDFIMTGAIEVEIYGKRSAPFNYPLIPVDLESMPLDLLPANPLRDEEASIKKAADTGNSTVSKPLKGSVGDRVPYRAFVNVSIGCPKIVYDPLDIEDEANTLTDQVDEGEDDNSSTFTRDNDLSVVSLTPEKNKLNFEGGEEDSLNSLDDNFTAQEELRNEITELEGELKEAKRELQRSKKLNDSISGEKQKVIDQVSTKLTREARNNLELKKEIEAKERLVQEINARNQKLTEKLYKQRGFMGYFRRPKTYSELVNWDADEEASSGCNVS